MKKGKSDYFLPEVEQELIKQLRSGEGLPSVMAPLIKRLVEAGLEGELDCHLSEEQSKGQKNRRNGLAPKTLRSEYGPIEISPSRDRSGTFEPELVGKRDRQLGCGLEHKVLSLYGLGMSYEDMRGHLRALYAVEMSDGQLSAITDRVTVELERWRSRPLEPLYAMAWLDAIRYKVRENGRVATKTVYFIIGVDLEGQRDVLGFYIGDFESSKFWLQVLTNLQARGVKDVLIASIDNLNGFAEAIESVFPDCQVQLCVVHQVRNSLKYVPYKDYKAFAAGLKTIYRAADEQQALAALERMEATWAKKYAPALENWRRDWLRLTPMFQYGPEIRRLIYTTNTVEGLNRQLRKATKTKGAFTSEDALKKLLYLTVERILAKWNTPIYAWKIIFTQLKIHFNERLSPFLQFS
jgi:transposase-like protein